MYARGMSTRNIEAHLREIYGVDVSATLISQVTEEVMDEVRVWQSRPLEPLYMIVYLDALVVKMRHEGRVENRAVFVAIGVTWRARKNCWDCGPAPRKEPSCGCRRYVIRRWKGTDRQTAKNERSSSECDTLVGVVPPVPNFARVVRALAD